MSNTPILEQFHGSSPMHAEKDSGNSYHSKKEYLKLYENYSNELSRIEQTTDELKQEEEQFYRKRLPMIQEKLRQDIAIDEETRNDWLIHLESDMHKSFEFSYNLLHSFAEQKLKEFRNTLKNELEIE